MNPETITHTTLKELAAAGAIRQASAVALGDRWSLVISYGGIQKTLAARNSQNIRSWANLNSLTKYLLELGIRRFEADARQFDPEQKTIARPDKSETLKQAHKAAAYQKWFKAEVEKSMNDKRPALSHEEFKARMESWLTKKYGPRPESLK